MNPKTFLWFMPLLAGAAAFLISSFTHSVETPSAGEKSTTRYERHSRKPITRSGDFQTGIDGIMRKSSGTEAGNDPSAAVDLTESALKERIGFLTEQLKSADPGDWDVMSHLDQQLSAAVLLLGNKGGSNLEWIRENHPDRLHTFVEGWARVDPKAVLSYLANSTEPEPCHPGTLMTVLDHLGANEPNEFLTAVRSVPWELFLFPTNDPFDESVLKLDNAADLALWLDSGAARFLGEQGVEISNLYHFWAREDLEASLQGWAEWSESDSRVAVGALSEILRSHLDDDERVSALNASLEQLDESRLSRMKETWKKIEERRPWAADRIRESVPLFQSESSAEVPPP